MAARDPLVERWLSPDGTRLAASVVEAMRRGRSLAALAFGEVAGRVDLRGLRTELPRVKGRRAVGSFDVEVVDRTTTLEKVRLEGLDLTGAFLPSMMLDRCVVRDCVFERASCQNLAVFGGQISDTSFAHADLRSAGPLGAWEKREGTTFTRCSFAHADLRGTTTGVADFVECDFSHARLDKVEFNHAGFVGCRFAGHLRDVVFSARGRDTKRRGDNPFSRNDLGDVTLEYVAFRGLDLADCVLPRAPGHLVLRHWHCALERAWRMTEGDQSLPARIVHGITENKLKSSTPAVRVNVVAEADFDEAREWAVELLRRCDAECGS